MPKDMSAIVFRIAGNVPALVFVPGGGNLYHRRDGWSGSARCAGVPKHWRSLTPNMLGCIQKYWVWMHSKILGRQFVQPSMDIKQIHSMYLFIYKKTQSIYQTGSWECSACFCTLLFSSPGWQRYWRISNSVCSWECHELLSTLANEAEPAWKCGHFMCQLTLAWPLYLNGK